jgi:hypothetical protein
MPIRMVLKTGEITPEAIIIGVKRLYATVVVTIFDIRFVIMIVNATTIKIITKGEVVVMIEDIALPIAAVIPRLSAVSHLPTARVEAQRIIEVQGTPFFIASLKFKMPHIHRKTIPKIGGIVVVQVF